MTMTRRRRVRRRLLERFMAALLGIAALGVGVTLSTPARAAAAPRSAPPAMSVGTSPALSAGTPAGRHQAVIGDVAFDYLPSGLGRPSEFTYEFQGVHFVSRVWETYLGTAGWRSDLDIVVMHGAHLQNPQEFQRWFVAYEERYPKPTYLPFRIHRHAGWLTQDQLFWLIRPGLAVSVTFARPPWTTYDAVQTAWHAYSLRRPTQ